MIGGKQDVKDVEEAIAFILYRVEEEEWIALIENRPFFSFLLLDHSYPAPHVTLSTTTCPFSQLNSADYVQAVRTLIATLLYIKRGYRRPFQ
jgi:hypothetical protein